MRQEPGQAQLAEQLLDWSDAADGAACSLFDASRLLLEATLAPAPQRPFERAMLQIELAGHSFCRLIGDINKTLGLETRDLQVQTVRALWDAHEEIERLQDLVDPEAPNPVLRSLRRTLACLAAELRQ